MTDSERHLSREVALIREMQEELVKMAKSTQVAVSFIADRVGEAMAKLADLDRDSHTHDGNGHAHAGDPH